MHLDRIYAADAEVGLNGRAWRKSSRLCCMKLFFSISRATSQTIFTPRPCRPFLNSGGFRASKKRKLAIRSERKEILLSWQSAERDPISHECLPLRKEYCTSLLSARRGRHTTTTASLGCFSFPPICLDRGGSVGSHVDSANFRLLAAGDRNKRPIRPSVRPAFILFA